MQGEFCPMLILRAESKLNSPKSRVVFILSRNMNYKKDLIHKINQKTAKVGIVGMGYVGMPLGELSAAAGFKTAGFVRDQKKADAIAAEKIPNLTSTIDKKELKKADIILICVQTPVF